jgi:hypothetical protein
MALEMRRLKTPPAVPSNPIVLMYRRHSASTFHGRIIPLGHEEVLLEILQGALNKEGNTLSFERQFDLFSRATLVVGPHGAGLANLAWMTADPIGVTASMTVEFGVTDSSPAFPLPVDRLRRPAVLEFVCSKETMTVQNGCLLGMSFWSLYGGAPWINYYHMLLARNSTKGGLYVERNEFETSINTIFESWAKASKSANQGRSQVAV